MKKTVILKALVCALIPFGVTGTIKNATAMPQSIQNMQQKASEHKVCMDENSKNVFIDIHLDSNDQNNLELARHMEKVMVHFGYSAETTRALFRAHLKTGVDFKLLVLKAIMESDYGHHNVAANSSARGIFQYIEPTWMVLIHRYGAQIGYAHYASAILYNPKSKTAQLKGAAKHLRGEILALRYDQEVSALIKALQIIEETDVISTYKNGNPVTTTDHYIAHMLGLYVMKDFYKLKDSKSSITPAHYSSNAHMREAAATNRSFFYKGGIALTATQSYKLFEERVEKQFRKISQMNKAKLIEVSKGSGNIPCKNETDAPLEAPDTLKTVIR